MSSNILELAQIIRRERRKREIPQNEIAEYIGISQSFYSQFERGKTDMKIAQIEKAVQFLNLEISFIIKGFEN